GGVGGEGGDEIGEGAAGFSVVEEGLGEGADEVAGVDAGELDRAGLEGGGVGPAGDGVHERGLLGPQGGELLEAEGAVGELFAEGGEAEPGEPHAGEEGRHGGARGVLAGGVELVEAKGRGEPAGSGEGGERGKLPGGA